MVTQTCAKWYEAEEKVKFNMHYETWLDSQSLRIVKIIKRKQEGSPRNCQSLEKQKNERAGKCHLAA